MKTPPALDDYSQLVADDVGHLLHPMAPAVTGDPLILAEGHGCWLTDAQGDVYLDANSGLMNVTVGYGRRELADVASESMARLAYAKLFWGHSSVAAIRLAKKLASITAPGIERFFFTSSGSEATESVIKLVRFRNCISGRPEKVKIIAREHSYHGMSLGAWSATGESAFWRNFGPRVPGFVHIPQPAPDDPTPADALEEAIQREGAETIAAFIAEPVSLPSRVNIPREDYWPRVRELCRESGILLVLDEVVTGFGRTGRWFASEHWSVEPDLVVLSKGITSGYIPLGAVGMTEAFADDLRATKDPVLHGFTSGGHPVACDVALRNIQIIEEESLVENAAKTGAYLVAEVDRLGAATNSLARARGLGMLAAVDMVADRAAGIDFPSERGVGAWVIEELQRGRTIMRSYSDTLLLGLPLSAGHSEVDELVRRLGEAVRAIPAEFRDAG